MPWLSITTPTAIALQWADALSPLTIEHPNADSKVLGKIIDDRLTIYLDHTRDTVDGRRRDNFQISTVRLAYYPGARLARAWMAAAWSGYVLHESLELVHVAGHRPIDPHLEVDGRYPYDRGLRCGFPYVLTPDTLIETLCVAMPEAEARRFVGE